MPSQAADPGARRGASSRKVQAFEWARALGALCVVVIHAFVTTRLEIPGADLAAPRYVAQDLVDVVLTRWAVPVFFMISGALMLDPAREMGPEKVWRHVKRMCFVICTFGFAFALVEAVVDAGAFGWAQIGAALVATLSGHSWDHMWYVYATLGLYLVTPILRPFVAGADARGFGRLLVALTLLALGIPTIDYLAGTTAGSWITFGFPVIYYLWGWYAHAYMRLDRRVWTCGLVALAIMVAGALWLGAPDAAYPEYLPVLPWSLLVFLLFKRHFERPLPRFWALLASYSFGIYICHPIFQHLMARLFDLGSWPALACDVSLVAIPLACSIALVWLLRKIPVFRRMI